jgi:hypothetical protein
VVESCQACQEIVGFERALDRRVEELVRRHAEACAPIRAENARRWEAFAKRCRGFLGERFQRKTFAPELVEEPVYYEHPWYKPEGKAIQADARTLEEMKMGHAEHFGAERVNVDDGDPHGPYVYLSRSECHEKGYRPFLPDTYDFSSAAGVGKWEVGRTVMCATTKTLVDKTTCNWWIGENTDRKIVYWQKSVARPPFLKNRGYLT